MFIRQKKQTDRRTFKHSKQIFKIPDITNFTDGGYTQLTS